MRINHRCVVDLLEENDILLEYIDNYTPTITYYFGRAGQLTFDSACIPIWLAQMALRQFNMDSELDKIQRVECIC